MTTEKPKERNEFLGELIRMFGAEHGVELYQSAKVTKRDLANFTALREKFGVEVKRRLSPSQLRDGFGRPVVPGRQQKND